MRVTAAVLRELNTPLVIEALELDAPRSDEVLVRIAGTGVCQTDILLIRGHPFPVPRPIVLGHEGSGIVEKVGSAVEGIIAGDHVVLSFDHCGVCSHCHDGEPAYCDRFDRNFTGRRKDDSTTLAHAKEPVFGSFFGQSSFATHALASARNVVKVPKDLPLQLLGPLGCGIQTGAGAVINALRPGVGDSIAIFGAGAVGLSAMLAARVMGLTTLIVVDLHESRLKLAMELGATHAINAGVGDVAGEIAKISPRGVNFSLDASGAPPAIAAAIGSLSVRGTCGIVGGGPPVPLNIPFLMQGGRTVRGIGIGDSVPDLFIPRLIELYRQGRFPFDRLLQFYPLDQINVAIADSRAGRAIKPVIIM